MPSEEHTAHTPQTRTENVLEYLALVWVGIAERALLLPAYVIGIIVLAILIGMLEPELAIPIVTYLALAPLAIIVCVMGLITVILAIVGDPRD